MWVEVLKLYPHTLPGGGRRQPEHLLQSNGEEDKKAGYRRQWETPQRQRASLQTWGPQHRYRQM